MDVLGAIIFAALMLAVLTAWVADRHGRSFWVYFVVTLLIPGVAIFAIPYLLIFTRTVPPELRSTASKPEPAVTDRVAHLERLARLRETGALSDTEFEMEKARLLKQDRSR